MPQNTKTHEALLDANADGKPDLVYRDKVDKKIYACLGLGTTSGPGLGQGRLWMDKPVDALAHVVDEGMVVVPTHSYQVSGLFDFNGDGYIDYLERNSSSPQYVRVYLGGALGINPTPAGPSGGYLWPYQIGTGSTFYAAIRHWDYFTSMPRTLADYVDVNGDGNPDVVKYTPSTQKLYVAYGRGSNVESTFELLGNGPISNSFWTQGGNDRRETVGLFDINGDGKLDRVEGTFINDAHGTNPHFHVRLNKGNGWNSSPEINWMFPANQSNCDLDTGGPLPLNYWILGKAQDVMPAYNANSFISLQKVLLVDFDGDGHLELLRAARDIVALKWTTTKDVIGSSIQSNTPWCGLSTVKKYANKLHSIYSDSGVGLSFDYSDLPVAMPGSSAESVGEKQREG